MTSIEIIFYLVCLGQIFLLSYHYPSKMIKRVTYILDNYSAKNYPKLYPTDIYVNPEKITRSRLNIFKYINHFVALVGIGIIFIALISGFRLDATGDTSIFVALYLLLQFIPHAMIEYYQYKHYQHIRKMNRATKRSANLSLRKLSDFISPIFIGVAVGLFVIYNILLVYYEGAVSAWDFGIWVMFLVVIIINGGYVIMVYYYVNSWKLDPLQTDADKYMMIENNIKVYVFSSILMSVFFIIINTIREYNLDIWEPILMSVYFQLIIIFGIGFLIRNVKVEELDFEVYQAKP